MMRYGIAAVVAAVLILPLAAQFTERIDVRVHELEVIVETRNGKPVTNLTRDDFVVLQDGVEQTITNFSVISESAATAVTADNKTVPAASPVQTATATAERKPRKFVFFIDEFEMHDSTRDKLLKQMSDLVGDMEQGDEAMVVTPSLPQRIPQFFTRDRDALMNTLKRVTGEMMRKSNVQALGALGGGETLGRSDCGQSIYACSERRLQDLQAVCRALSDVPGRKAVVVMTTLMTSVPGLTLNTPKDASQLSSDEMVRGGAKPIVSDYRDLRRLVRETARVAAGSNVAIYGIEAYEPGYSALPGVTVDGFGGGRGDRNIMSGGSQNEAENSPQSLKGTTVRGQTGTQDMLQTLASMTGAKAYSGTDDSVHLFEQISSDLGSYYSIAYRDSEGKTKEHKVEVRIRNRNDLVVRTRGTVRTREREEEERGLAMAAALSSRTSNPLHIQLTASTMVRRGRIVEIPIHVHIPLSKLVFIEQGDKRRAQFRVLVAAVNEQGAFGDTQSERTQDITVPNAKWDQAQTQHFVYDTTVRVTPAKYRIAVGVTDLTTGESSFQTVLANAF